jgi:hypothetical protein
VTDKIVIRWVNDEAIDIELNGLVLVTANHDDHGWDGMRLAIDLTRAIAGGMGASVMIEGTPNL